MELNKNIMEQKFIRVSFDLELAKKITEKSIEGKIVTRDGRSVRVLCWDAKADQCIVALLLGEFYEECGTYTKDGRIFMNGESPADLMLEIPEYMTFKDGDILSYDNGTFILKRFDGKNRIEYYVNSYDCYYRLSFDSACVNTNLVDKIRPAAEEEKHKLINALKASKEPKAIEYMKRFLGIEEKPECEFKPFDKVLVRNFDYNKWSADIFSHIDIDGDMHECVGGIWNFCIPYNEKTAHLLGTTENYESE